MNSVTLIGLCIEVASNSIKIKIDDDIFDVFFDETDDLSSIDEGRMTKIVGKMGYKEFPFPIIIGKQVYQINTNPS